MDKEKERMSELYSKLGEYHKHNVQIELMNEKCKLYISKNKQLEEECAFVRGNVSKLIKNHSYNCRFVYSSNGV